MKKPLDPKKKPKGRTSAKYQSLSAEEKQAQKNENQN